MTEGAQNDWPPQIEIEEEADCVRYRLPVRDLGRPRAYAWIILAAIFALLISIVACQVPIGRAGQAWRPFGLVFTVFVVLAMAFPAYCLLLYLFGQCQIEIRDGELFVTERAGVLRRRRRWPLTQFKQLQVMGLVGPSPGATSLRSEAEALVEQYQTSRARRRLGTDEPGSQTRRVEAALWVARHLNVLTGVLEDNRRCFLAAGYPRDWLTRLADDISARSNAAVESPDRHKLENAPPVLGLQSIVALAEEDSRLTAEPDVFEQPPGSDIQVDSFDGGLTLRVPPAGRRKGSAGLFPFAILWIVFIAGFTAIIAAFGLGQRGFGGGGLMISALFISLFWLIGIGMLLAGWNMGRREAALAVVDGKLLVMQTGLRGSKRREWPIDKIASVRVGPSGMAVNDVPVMELQIHGHKEKLLGLLAGRDKNELAWMASVVRWAMKQEPADDQPGPTSAS